VTPAVPRLLATLLARGLSGVLVGVLALTGCTSQEGTGDSGYISGDGAITQRAVDQREEPIELTGEDLDGQELDLAELRGTPVVVVVWGSWCPPCVAEAPDVVEAAERLGDEAQFVGINLRDGDPAQGRAFERNYEVPFPSFYSPDGREMLAFEGVLTPRSIPAFVILDEEGRVAASINGGLPSVTTLVELVEDVTPGREASARG
jgi:thiol-disulfide isomerase/thioredoxin